MDDVAFILAMIDDMTDKVAVDEAQIFVTGASNGGMMTYRLGCETAGVFAGIAPVIGNIPEPIAAACQPSPSLAFLSLNVVTDTYCTLTGGEVWAAEERCGEAGSTGG